MCKHRKEVLYIPTETEPPRRRAPLTSENTWAGVDTHIVRTLIYTAMGWIENNSDMDYFPGR